jgi:hypothetical protein
MNWDPSDKVRWIASASWSLATDPEGENKSEGVWRGSKEVRTSRVCYGRSKKTLWKSCEEKHTLSEKNVFERNRDVSWEWHRKEGLGKRMYSEILELSM